MVEMGSGWYLRGDLAYSNFSGLRLRRHAGPSVRWLCGALADIQWRVDADKPDGQHGRVIKLLKAGKIDKSERVVVISTAHGLKFVEMKVKYHQKELDFPCRHANRPIELPARLDAVKSALKKALKERSRFDV